MGETSRVTGTAAGGDSVSMQVVDALASELGRAPTEIEPLAASIDPEALDEVLEASGGAAVSFDHAGCTVQVSTRGTHMSVDITRNVTLGD